MLATLNNLIGFKNAKLSDHRSGIHIHTHLHNHTYIFSHKDEVYKYILEEKFVKLLMHLNQLYNNLALLQR